MGRPIKSGMVYFPLDVDWKHDLRVRKLMKAQGGKAALVYIDLLSIIYKCGYCKEWDNDLPFIISEDLPGYEEVYILEVIKYCLKIGLLDREAWERDKVLTSEGIQRRYTEMMRQSKRKGSVPELPRAVAMRQELPGKAAMPAACGEMGVNSEETRVNSEETRVNSELSAQNKIKEKEKKTECMDEGTALRRGEDRHTDGKENFDFFFDEHVEAVRRDAGWLDSWAARLRVRGATVRRELEAWSRDCELRGRRHGSLVDAKRHFGNWLQCKQRNGKLTDGNGREERHETGGERCAGGGAAEAVQRGRDGGDGYSETL